MNELELSSSEAARQPRRILLLGLSFVNGRDSRLLAVDSAMIAVRVVLLSSGIGVASAGIFWWIATGGSVGVALTTSNHAGSRHADDHG